MKLLILILATVICSCSHQAVVEEQKASLEILGDTTIEGCQYFMVHGYMYPTLCHKGNCNNLIHLKQ